MIGKLEKDPRAALSDMLDGVHAGMLGLSGQTSGFQPMTHHADGDTGTLWFISSTETDLVQALGAPQPADYVIVSKGHDAHASLRGTLSHIHNDAKLDTLWGPMAAAWFPKGRQDPTVALLRFDPADGQIWASSTSVLKFGMEMLRANMDSDHQPDLGQTATLHFPARG